jgi:hypothetical protein
VQHLWLAPAFRDLLTTGMEVHQRGSLPLLSVAGPRITGLESALKRGLDLLLALLVLPVALPLSLAIALWLKGVRKRCAVCCGSRACPRPRSRRRRHRLWLRCLSHR